ncbi:hypothetical protein CDO73_08770 [Saccharibacillus sp. O23]|uniref:hypothetical protein n=1 Tax=Saccharibacillus sp. O23 TaxID=2009338 RepID=UPI000B4E51C4|nr:hypothetical protein [Saccharibacillus sp. O23]OWR30681.1 hypothetical protein CDO73_08770 [Saccharibacillus sp. O23]
MKNFPKALIAALLICSAALATNDVSAYAASPASSPDPWLSAETALPVGGVNVLLRSSGAAAFLNTDSGKLDVLPPGQKVLDAQVLTNPTKWVLLTADESGAIEKQVFDSDGKILRATEYPVKLPEQGEARWAAPTAKTQERLMIRSGNRFTLYDTAGHQVLRYDATIRPNASYEYASVDDWDFSAYPYLAVEYEGQRIMASDFFVRVVNLYDKSVRELPGLAIDKQLEFDARSRLRVWTSFGYDGIRPANATSPDPSQQQSFHAVYDPGSGKAAVDHKLRFDLQEGSEPSGWQTQTAGDYVFVRDLTAGSWNLYAADGKQPIASAQTGLETNARFVRYDPASKTAYFLVGNASNAGKPTLRKIRL